MKIFADERPIHLVQPPEIWPTTPPHIQPEIWQTFRRRTILAWCLAMAVLVSSSQRGLAQIVQLPSLHKFSSTGSVLVPDDGGRAMLGGSGAAQHGSTSSSFGPLSNRAQAGSAGGSTLSASVQIIDLEALDQAILASATPRTSMVGPAAPPATVAGGPAASPGTDNLQDVGQRARLSSRYSDSTRQLSANYTEQVNADPGAWQRALSGGGAPPIANASMVESNVRYYVELGEQAERSGSAQAARVYYRLARQAMTPELEKQYENALRARAAEAAARSAAEQEQARRKF